MPKWLEGASTVTDEMVARNRIKYIENYTVGLKLPTHSEKYALSQALPQTIDYV